MYIVTYTNVFVSLFLFFFLVFSWLFFLCGGAAKADTGEKKLILTCRFPLSFLPRDAETEAQLPGWHLDHALGMSKNGVILGYARISMDVFHEDMDI